MDVIIYGLGKKYHENKEFLNSNLNIVGYSDRDEEKKQDIDDVSKFVSIDNFLDVKFDKIVICGGGRAAKEQICYKYFDTIRWEDIILLDDLLAPKIDKEIFYNGIRQYNATNKHENFSIDENNIYPIVTDIAEGADKLDGHYFLQDICVAQKILKANPAKHFDIGSRVDGFISHLLVFRDNVTMIDVRPLDYQIEGLEFIQADATELTGIENNSIESLSCLHAVEHFGLGRYGDQVNGEACFLAMQSFERVLKPNGKLYLSVPCGGRDAVYFNAHRMFYPKTIINELSGLVLVEFEVVKDFKVIKVDINNDALLGKLGDYYCGIFTFTKYA